MVHVDRPVPDGIPGERVVDEEQLYHLRSHLASICGLNSTRFPGSQPVSFDLESLTLLEEEDFWVCEKSDGVRVLVLILATETGQEVYLIDRKEEWYRNYNLTFPHQDGPAYNHSNTVLDGELVIDVDPETGRHMLRLLAFDLLVCDSDNLMHKSLTSRYGRLKMYVVEPYHALLKAEPERREHQPFEVILKPQELAYGIEAVFKDHLPKLLHGNDGLIFTSASAPYTSGTDRKILKWKPPSENSIDFTLKLKFPALADDPDTCDYTKKPLFMLFMNHGQAGVHYYDMMNVDDDTWETWKESEEQYEDRVVEVVWDKDAETWKLLRFRDDKHDGNFKTVVTAIIKSIQHGVEAETLIAHAPRIKAALRARNQRAAEASRPQPPRDAGQQRAQGHPSNGNGSASMPPRGGGGGMGGGLKR